ncbi:MAG: DUF3794 domain-containing protein [Limnochordaceae bacterium]|nr:DUF3794 domain-containing protein [Limnochordaceae bacterium]
MAQEHTLYAMAALLLIVLVAGVWWISSRHHARPRGTRPPVLPGSGKTSRRIGISPAASTTAGEVLAATLPLEAALLVQQQEEEVEESPAGQTEVAPPVAPVDETSTDEPEAGAPAPVETVAGEVAGDAEATTAPDPMGDGTPGDAEPPEWEPDAPPPASSTGREPPIRYEGAMLTVGVDPLVKAEVVVAENSRQVLQEWRTPLPAGTIKVRDITHRIVDVRCELLDDKVIVQLVLEKQVFYVGPDNLVHHLGERVPVSTFVDVPGTRPGMHCQPTVTVERILFHLEDCVLVQKIMLDVFVKVTQREHVNLVEQPGGLPIKALEVVADVTGQMVEEIPVTLSVPAIKVVEVRVSIPPEFLTIEPINDKVIIQGLLHKQIFFVDEANVERHQAVDVPFSHFVEAPGTRPEHVVIVEPVVVFTAFDLLFPDGASATTQMLEKVVVDFLVNVARLRIMSVVENPAGVLIKAEVVLGQGTNQIMLERDVTLSVGALKISDVLARVENLRAISLPGKVLIQGTVHKQLFFVGLDDGLEHHQAETIPFSAVVEVVGSAPDLLVQVTPTIEHIQTELLSPTLVHQKVILRFDVVVGEERQVRLQTAPYPYPLPVVPGA